MADIKDIFGESDSEDDGGAADEDVGKLFALSDDEDDEPAPIQRKRLQKGPAAGPAAPAAPRPAAMEARPADAGDAYDDEDDGEMDDADRAFIDTEGDDKELLAEYAKEKQNFKEGGRADDFEQGEEPAKKQSGSDRDANNPMAPTLERMKRRKRKELATDEKDKVVQGLLQRMSDALAEDRAAVAAEQPATAKIRLLDLVQRVFKQRALRQTLLDFDALDLAREWLSPLADGSKPLLQIRTGLLEAMKDMPAQPEHLKRSGIGRTVMKMANDKQETAENRRAARRLVENWARPVVGKVNDLKSLQRATASRLARPDVEGRVEAVQQSKDDAAEIFDREGAESADRPRVRVPQFDGFDFTIRPQSTADPARSKKKAAPAAGTATERLHKRTKRRGG